ncbi:uncharacterized protein J3R85_008352 [Psidium guajava]|nr:uncharacterized protein J3R85_008352 [Psidium guajava]
MRAFSSRRDCGIGTAHMVERKAAGNLRSHEPIFNRFHYLVPHCVDLGV